MLLHLTWLTGATYKKMIQNLVWVAGYNIIAIPLAGVLYYRELHAEPRSRICFNESKHYNSSYKCTITQRRPEIIPTGYLHPCPKSRLKVFIYTNFLPCLSKYIKYAHPKKRQLLFV